MSTTIYKKIIKSNDPTWYDANITERTLREIAEYGRSISGVIVDESELPYKFYSSFNFTGGNTEQCVFQALSSNQCYFGVVKDRHELYERPDTYVQFSVYQHPVDSGTGNRAFNELYLIVKDNKLIGMSCRNAVTGSNWFRDSGLILFYYDSDGFRVLLQAGTGGNYVSPLMGDLKAFDGSNNAFGTIILAGEYELCGRIPYRILGYDMISYCQTPSGKALVYPLYMNDVANRIDKSLDLPVGIKCDDLGITTEWQKAPTYQKIRIGDQNYMHFGDQIWIPYDTYSESEIIV